MNEDEDEDDRAGEPSGGALRIGAALVVVALGAAVFALAFRAGLHAAYRALVGSSDVLAGFTRLPRPARLVLPAVGALAAGLLSRASAKASAQNFGDVMEAVVLGGRKLSVRGTLWKALGSWVAIAGGNSVGREGPLIQFGGSFGGAVATRFGLSSSATRALIASGTAAGFAAAYNTPLAAVLFAVEVVTGVVAIDALAMILLCTAIATTLVRAVAGGGPIYGERVFTISTPRELFAHAVLGLLAGVAAHVFMRMLAVGERGFQRTNVRQPWRATLGGLLTGALAMVLPEVVGNGYEPLNVILDGRYAASLVAGLIVAKALATTSSVSSGSPGGVFTPSMFIGGGLGFVWGHLAGTAGSEGSYALVGMAAMIAATTHAPLMASVLVFELSGDYAIVVPLVIATAIATLLSRRLGRDSIYASELRRRGLSWEITLGGRTVKSARGENAPDDP